MGREKKGKPRKGPSRSHGRFCRRCGRRVYWVVNVNGYAYPVTSIGRKGVPWGAAVCDAP